MNKTARTTQATTESTPLFPLQMSEYGTPEFPIEAWTLFKHSGRYKKFDNAENDAAYWLNQEIEDLNLLRDVDFYSDKSGGIYLTPWAGLHVASTFSKEYAEEASRQMALAISPNPKPTPLP